MSKYLTVVFDLDGTLLDTLDDLAFSVNEALEKNHMPRCTRDEIRMSVGNGVRNLVERSVPGGRENPAIEQVFADFKSSYALHCNDQTRPYDGVPEMLAALKAQGFRLAIVSNKPDFAVKTLREIYFKDSIPVAIGEKETVRKKPAPDTVLTALKELDAPAESAVYIGDSDVDVATAANSGMDEIAVTWGFRDRAFLEAHGALRYADTPAELTKLLLEA